MASRSPTPRKRSRLTGDVIPRCACGKAVYANGKCYEHHQSIQTPRIPGIYEAGVGIWGGGNGGNDGD